MLDSLPIRLLISTLGAAMLIGAAGPAVAQSAGEPTWAAPLLLQSQSPVTPLAADAQETWQGPTGRPVHVVVQVPRLPANALRVEVRPPPTGEEAGPVIDKALTQLRVAGGGRLVLAPGRYTLNQVDRLKACHLCIEDLHDVSIEGEGAEFVFGKNSDGIVISRSQRIRISGLSLRYALRTSSIGKIVEQDGRKLLQLDSGGDPEDEIRQMVEFDPTLGRWPSTGKRFLFPTGDARTPKRVAQGLYSADAFAPLPAGLRFSIHHQWYGGIAVRALDTVGPNQDEDLTFQRLKIDNTPGMGIVGYGVRRGFAVLDSRIGPAADRCEQLSAAWDAIHVQIVTGDILIKNNRLACSGDDAINVASPVSPVVSRTSDSELRIGRYSRFIRSQDTLALFDRENHWLANVRADGDPVALGGLDFSVRVQGPLPAAAGTIFVRDLQMSTLRYAIEGNDIGPCACNAVLAQAAHGLIRGNRIKGVSHAGVKLLSNTGSFQEGTGAFNVLVEKNSISESGMNLETRLGSGDWGAINVYGLGPGKLHNGPTNTDIAIKDNSVDGTDQACIAVTSTWRVQVINNSCKDTNRGRAGPSLRFTMSNGVQVIGNVRSGRSTGGLDVDSTNGPDVRPQTNY